MTYCIFRTDRIGDVVLTLPLASVLKRHDPAARVLFCAQDYTAGLVRLCPDVDDVISIPEHDVAMPAAYFGLRLREYDIDTAVFAFPRPGLAMAAARAGIPCRVGTAYRWFSSLFTHRRKEHRRGGGAHERDYNLGLLKSLGIDTTAPPLPRLHIPERLDEEARLLLEAAGIDADERFVVLHPGSGGSARDWPAESFGALGEGLLRERPDLRLLITGTTKESALMERVQDLSGDEVMTLPKFVSLDVLAAVLNRAALVVANSTGPLHVASAVGTPVIGLYPFMRTCHPRRWGPLGVADVFTPAPQPGCARCAAEDGDAHDDMKRIAVPEVLAAALRRLDS